MMNVSAPGALVPRKLVTIVVVLAAAAAIGAALYAVLGRGPESGGTSGAVSWRQAPTSAASPVARTPRRGRVLAVGEAMRELDLVRPPRQKFAEDFTLLLADGRRFRLADQRGKVVLVNFWATWCPPCREEMPAMERLWQHQKDQNFVLVAVSVDADSKVVPPYLDRYKFSFPVALDPKLNLANAYGVRALPSSFLVDREGYVTALALGPRPWDSDASQSLIEGLLR